MKRVTHFLFCLFCLACLSLPAKNLTSYQIGDFAEADVIAPVDLDVADPAATAALQAAKAQQFPAVFRSFPNTTNVMTRDFLAAFAQARSNFLAEMTIEFHAPTADETTIASADFGRLVTVFGIENRNFPVSDELAAEWARGGDGQVIREKLLATLQWVAARPVCPDALPKGMTINGTIRLVQVTGPDQKLTLETAQQGQLVPAASLTTLTNAQALFRREFPKQQQLFARALAAFIQPNCQPDAAFTQLTRGAEVYQLVVANHFDAGDAIVRQGDKIDAKNKAALLALNEKLAASPPATPVIAISSEPPPPPVLRTPPAPTSIAQSPAQPAVTPLPAAKTGLRHWGLVLTLAGISVGATLLAGWQFLRERKRAAALTTAAQTPLPFPDTAKTGLAPHVADVVREAVQHELAMQRRELLVAQQAATAEITALVHRLDDLQVPMQERLHTYEARIQMLEKELALRDEENRQLLKLKIEMTRTQMLAEHATTLRTSTSA